MIEQKHPLEIEYGLTAYELLDALQNRFRARVTLEGAVAEVHLGAILTRLQYENKIGRFEQHDADGMHDFTLILPHFETPLLMECKNVRNSKSIQVEVQKTRTSKGDPSSRFYAADQFDIIAVCMGKKNRNWKQFVFASVSDLKRHKEYPEKLAVMHPIKTDVNLFDGIWHSSIEALLEQKYPKP